MQYVEYSIFMHITVQHKLFTLMKKKFLQILLCIQQYRVCTVFYLGLLTIKKIGQSLKLKSNSVQHQSLFLLNKIWKNLYCFISINLSSASLVSEYVKSTSCLIQFNCMVKIIFKVNLANCRNQFIYFTSLIKKSTIGSIIS